MKTLYLECASGISGDMTVAALLDLGADRAKLDAALANLRCEGLDWRISRKSSHGIEGCDFDVVLNAEHHEHNGSADIPVGCESCDEHAHEHSHEHHGHAHEHASAHKHAHNHEHHEHEHEHHEHIHPHAHRNLADVCAVIDRAEMSAAARAIAKKTFAIIAEAEAKAHGKPVDQVHFHEVGALDSIADIVGAAVLADDLGITGCVVAAISEGTGFVACQHGELPVPVPAVLNIASKHSIPLRIKPEIDGEMCTPTGIALAAALRTRAALPEQFVVEKTGIGLGKKDFGRANILRALIISDAAAPQAPCAPQSSCASPSAPASSGMWLLESNIDDSTGEQLGLALEKIFEAGAVDVHFVPCVMKKGRPAYLLRALAAEASLRPVEDAIFQHTTTIGIRRHKTERAILARETIEIALPFGNVEVKKCAWEGGVFFYPEYESVKALSAASGIPFKQIFDAAAMAAADAR
jgi:TIGR00299 family protein